MKIQLRWRTVSNAVAWILRFTVAVLVIILAAKLFLFPTKNTTEMSVQSTSTSSSYWIPGSKVLRAKEEIRLYRLKPGYKLKELTN